MNNNQNHSKDFLIGAAVGTVIGGITALLVAPQKGEDLRQDIKEAYDDFSEKTQEFTEDIANRGRALANSFGSQVNELAEEAEDAYDSANRAISSAKKRGKKELKDLKNLKDAAPDTYKGMLIGGALGSALGIATGMLLAPKSGETLRQDIMDVCDFKNGTKKLYRDSKSSLGEKVQSGTRQLLDLGNQILSKFETGEEKGAVKSKEILNDIAEWASIGIQAFQKINQTLAKK